MSGAGKELIFKLPVKECLAIMVQERNSPEILLCDLDAFFASVEQRDRPEYRGRRLSSAAARIPRCRLHLFVRSAQIRCPFGHALGRSAAALPRGCVFAGRHDPLPCVSEQVFAIYGRFTPEIEIVSIDEAYLDLPSGEGLAAAGEIHRAVWKSCS